MKKILLLIAVLMSCTFFAAAQMNESVSVNDDIYEFLDVAQRKGLCSPLNGYKPYTRSQILNLLREIYDNSELMSERETEITEEYLKIYEPSDEKRKNNFWRVEIKNNNEKFQTSFNFKSEFDFMYSGGLYTNSAYDSYGFDNIYKFSLYGDFTKYISYRVKALLDITKVPLIDLGNYFIGYAWYDSDIHALIKDDNSQIWPYADNCTLPANKARYIRKKLSYAYLPYSYKKPWSGQMYYLENLTAEGLEGWATKLGLGFTIDGEIRAAFLNNNIIIGMGRIDREVAAMDNGSSLVLNKRAQPFMGIDFQFKVFNALKFYSLTGILEYPNQDYINKDAIDKLGNPDFIDDAYNYQNAFSLNMVEIDLKRLHLDFGCSVIWPKRFELGYLFPLTTYVEYQNHIGDCDNLALFGDFKYTIPGVGSIWASLYLDEINGLNNNPFTSTRAMFAYQGGVKYILPKLPFASVSFRYTKVEPYCYTHQSINNASWYHHYINENYTNNGESIGYYLPPNSDEFLLSFNIKPSANSTAGASYQLIRHGADYGSQQVPGSSLYSELNIEHRNKLKKYFLHDGAYNWMHVLSTGGNYTLNTKVPVSFYGNLGIIFSYFTIINPDNYDRSVPGNEGNCKNADFSTPISIAGTDEYPTMFGAVLTLGVRINY